MRRRFGVVLPILLLIGAFAAHASAEQTYLLTAPTWGAAQTQAVVAAGGTVTFSHAETGIGTARSDNPGFLAQVLKSGRITRGELDATIQWQQPVPYETLDATFTNPPNNDRFFNTIQWAPQAIDAPGAWAAGCTGEGVRVAVLDGGIWNIHPDLAPNFDVARSASFVPGFSFNEDVGTFWHGTHVAGIIAAVDNAGDANSGVIGIAPKATLIGVKVLHDGSGAFAWVIQGILYAATPTDQGGAGADIINMSLGGYWQKAGGHNTLFAALNKAVNYAAGRGVLVVSAAGNDSIDLDHVGSVEFVPAQSGSGVAVSATGPLGFALGATDFQRPASYTNYGTSAINVAAPGGDFALPGEDPCTVPTTNGASLTRPCWVFDMVMSTNVGGWAWAAGTSMAAPAVSAVAALAKQGHPGISLGDLKTLLQRTAIDEGKPGTDPFYGKGWVNALNACVQ